MKRKPKVAKQFAVRVYSRGCKAFVEGPYTWEEAAHSLNFWVRLKTEAYILDVINQDLFI